MKLRQEKAQRATELQENKPMLSTTFTQTWGNWVASFKFWKKKIQPTKSVTSENIVQKGRLNNNFHRQTSEGIQYHLLQYTFTSGKRNVIHLPVSQLICKMGGKNHSWVKRLSVAFNISRYPPICTLPPGAGPGSHSEYGEKSSCAAVREEEKEPFWSIPEHLFFKPSALRWPVQLELNLLRLIRT